VGVDLAGVHADAGRVEVVGLQVAHQQAVAA
jgi:hypothetical protein